MRSSSFSSSGSGTRLAERGIDIELTPEATELVAEAGWDPTYGARPLKRSLQRLIENPLAVKLLEGEFAEGDTILVDALDGELAFEKAAAVTAAPRERMTTSAAVELGKPMRLGEIIAAAIRIFGQRPWAFLALGAVVAVRLPRVLVPAAGSVRRPDLDRVHGRGRQ